MAYRDTAQKLASHACGMAFSNYPQTMEDSLADALRKNVIIEIAAERQRQSDAEGYATEHDDEHTDGAIARAACAYAIHTTLPNATYEKHGAPAFWPWQPEAWKPKDKRRDLIRAAALLVAEIERLDRLGDRCPECFNNQINGNTEPCPKHRPIPSPQPTTENKD